MRGVTSTHLLASACALVALAGCETIAEEVNDAVGYEYYAPLAASSGGTGSGRAEISLNDATNTICTDLELGAGVTMTAGHIVGPGGAVIADLEVPDANDRDNDSDECDSTTDAVIDGIRANPGAYSVHIAASTGDLLGTLRNEPNN
ncbi:MAG TPA: CHRD domain-containing protein [Allosphingosinicella sp.]|jgi:hypothetical protein